MSRRLVIGLGNTLAGDDGFGPAVVRRLQEDGFPEGVEAVSSCTDLLGRIDTLASYDVVVLVDAVTGGDRPPGTVEVLQETTLLSWMARSTSAHVLSPVEALRVFHALAPDAPTRIVLVALHTDMLGTEPVHARAARIEEGVHLARVLLALEGK